MQSEDLVVLLFSCAGPAPMSLTVRMMLLMLLVEAGVLTVEESVWKSVNTRLLVTVKRKSVKVSLSEGSD